MISIICRVCSKKFNVWPYQLRNNAQFCSISCALKFRWLQPTKRMKNHIKAAQKIAAKSRIGSKHTLKSRLQISESMAGKLIGEKNPKWSGGISKYRKIVSLEKCLQCGIKKNLIVHHIDRNRHNNVIGNLKVLCPKCHCREHNHFNRWGNKK